MTAVTPVTIPIKQIQLSPGSKITIPGITWEQFEAILEELGEERITRIAYSNRTLEIMSPSPADERPNKIIGYIVNALLDTQGRIWEDCGSTTFKRRDKAVGLETNICFYIQKAQQVRDCMRMNLASYPPPDLAIETDTSRTTLDAYEAIGVAEVWVYNNGELAIHTLRNGGYIESDISLTFPSLSITEFIPRVVKQALQEGSSQVLPNFGKQIYPG